MSPKTTQTILSSTIDLITLVNNETHINRKLRFTPKILYLGLESDGWIKGFLTKPSINLNTGLIVGKDGEYGKPLATRDSDNPNIPINSLPFWYRIRWHNGKPIRASQNYYK